MLLNMDYVVDTFITNLKLVMRTRQCNYNSELVCDRVLKCEYSIYQFINQQENI